MPEVIGLLVTFLFLLLLGAAIFWILQTYVVPVLPPAFGKLFLAICGLIAVVVLIYLILPGGANFRVLPS